MSTDVTFAGAGLRATVSGIKITGLSPAIPGKRRNKVEVPGNDYEYDFGNNKKTNFTIDLEWKLVDEEGETSIWTRFSNLSDWLDHEAGQDFVINEFSGKAQVYESVQADYNEIKNVLTGTITFECWEE